MDEKTKKLLEQNNDEGTPAGGNETPAAIPQDSVPLEEHLNLRKKNQSLEAEIAALKTTTPPVAEQKTTDATEIAMVVENVLKKRDEERTLSERKANLASAIEKFKTANKEFHDENDKDGIKFSLIEKELANFNLSSAQSEEDFMSILKKAGITSGAVSEDITPAPVKLSTSIPIPKNGGSGATPDPEGLSKEELAVATKNGWTEERLKNLKNSMPMIEYVKLMEKHS